MTGLATVQEDFLWGNNEQKTELPMCLNSFLDGSLTDSVA